MHKTCICKGKSISSLNKCSVSFIECPEVDPGITFFNKGLYSAEQIFSLIICFESKSELTQKTLQ